MIEQDIATLSSMLNQIGTLAQKDSAQTASLALLSGSVASTATPNNIATAADSISRLHTSTASKTSSLHSAVTGEITRLKLSLSSFKTQDKSFHNTQNSN
ncbi:MAG: hypothetical protein FWE96_02175 [Coriobacteriia bacterium]|nr:hypothetical protein [Coriobacteriia bacterium]